MLQDVSAAQVDKYERDIAKLTADGEVALGALTHHHHDHVASLMHQHKDILDLLEAALFATQT